VIGDASAAPTQKSAPEPEAEKAPEPAPEPEPEPEPTKPASAPEPAPAAQSEKPAAAEPETVESTPYVTPLVRKLAAENDIDLNSIKGTGVGGRIRKQDVLAAADAAKAPAETAAPAASTPAAAQAPAGSAAPEVKPELAALRGTTQKINRIRQITAKKTRESLQT
ncbi:pyruvate dehydrogenase complex dihydrolipoyllysine-residue acetyltransferase, partial [Streptomyces sp. SID10244]|nr:pyruvate dehydrogenase complex dihydrolipoyllysine-residue acetyltransferase [Streptomyces sp. SID10244]